MAPRTGCAVRVKQLRFTALIVNRLLRRNATWYVRDRIVSLQRPWLPIRMVAWPDRRMGRGYCGPVWLSTHVDCVTACIPQQYSPLSSLYLPLNRSPSLLSRSFSDDLVDGARTCCPASDAQAVVCHANSHAASLSRCWRALRWRTPRLWRRRRRVPMRVGHARIRVCAVGPLVGLRPRRRRLLLLRWRVAPLSR